MVSLGTLLFGGGFFLIGLAMVAFGGHGLRRWWTMRRMDPNSMVVEPGVQEFEGRARAIDGTVTAPFTGSQSLLYNAEVERYSSSHNGSNWSTVNQDTEAAPFEVDHAGPTVAVDPANADHFLTDEFQVDTKETENLPPRVQEYVDENLETGSTIELGPIEVGGQRYRFTEERLDDGEEVYVLGPADRNPGAVPVDSDARLAVATAERDWLEQLTGDPFLISDTGEEGAKGRQLKQAVVVFLFGLVFGGTGLAVILFG